MSVTRTQKKIPLSHLALHPENVRAQSPDTYQHEDIQGLAASIQAVGLINALSVQKLGDATWGVLAGGRRLAAFNALLQSGEIEADHPIPCAVLPESFDAATALSFAENDTSRPMDPIDEFDGFARMLETGMTPEAIARAVGQTEARVKGRLRFALIAPEIRQAARAKAISLDAMKAFAEHPDHAVQVEVYQALNDADQLQTWTIRDRLRNRGTKLTDALGALVVETYKARGGEIAGDLLPEHSVLTDEALAETILTEKLAQAAEDARAAYGFAWAEGRLSLSWEEMQAFGRVYPSEITPDADGDVRLEAIAQRSEVIETQLASEDLDWEAQQALDEEWEALSEEAQALQEAYTPHDLAQAGVIAHWQHGRITLALGLVRLEDRETNAAPSQKAAPGPEAEVTLSQSLRDDLAVERATALGAALCGAHALAEDLLRFKTVMDVLQTMPCTYRLDLRAGVPPRPHAKPEACDQTAREAIEAFRAGLDLSFQDAGQEAGDHRAAFEAFRALKPAMKAKLVAYALSQTLQPSLARGGDHDLLDLLEPDILRDIRALWRPTGPAFFARLKKDQILRILRDDLGMPEEAANLASGTKVAAAGFLDTLFAEPFATLTEAQREAVARWAPEGMQTQGGPTADEAPEVMAAE